MAMSYVVSIYVPDILTLTAVWPVSVILLIGAAAVSDVTGRPTFLAHRTTVWFGQVTYAFYLVGLMMLFYPAAALAGQWPGYLFFQPPQWSILVCVLYILAVFVVQLGISAMLYSWVEVPIMRHWGPTATRRQAGTRGDRGAGRRAGYSGNGSECSGNRSECSRIRRYRRLIRI
jgi:peptidoglycan/LPS O-acetylase OafA/YrhL